ncbi:MAG: ATPase [Nocardioidaceae bacterium]|nr:ATPase [Nocardioidaceae bacterium]
MAQDRVVVQSVGLVLGGDVGGTSTRILVASHDGMSLRRGTAGGGNPTAHPETAADALDRSLCEALEGLDPAMVRAAVIGLAGGTALHHPRVSAAFGRVWAANGLTCAPAYVPDLEVAFAAGTAEPDGTVLIAGTGASAGALRDRRLIQTADGHGWLLGDDGSGFWLGREAARATLCSLDAGGPLGPLATSVLGALAIAEHPPAGEPPGPSHRRARVISTLNERPPIRLAELAPLVTSAFENDDAVAGDIVERAAGLLSRTLGRIREAGEVTPIVLAGSLAGERSPVGARLRAMVSERFAGDVFSAADGVGGAAWLALASLDPAAANNEVRARLVQH